MVGKVREVAITQRVDVIIVTDFLGTWTVKEGMLERVGGVLETACTTIVP